MWDSTYIISAVSVSVSGCFLLCQALWFNPDVNGVCLRSSRAARDDVHPPLCFIWHTQTHTTHTFFFLLSVEFCWFLTRDTNLIIKRKIWFMVHRCCCPFSHRLCVCSICISLSLLCQPGVPHVTVSGGWAFIPQTPPGKREKQH